jgi:hypothetical protein
VKKCVINDANDFRLSLVKVIFLAAWYPSEENPVRGIFVKEHAKAVALYNDVPVLAFSGASTICEGSMKSLKILRTV